MTGMTALLLFAAWTLVLVAVYFNYRVLLVLTARKRADSWGRGLATDEPGFVLRAQHAHLNCVENLPVFAAIVLGAYVLGKSAAVDSVAAWVLYARIGQSLIHLTGVSHWLVFGRGLLFGGQIALFFYMIVELL